MEILWFKVCIADRIVRSKLRQLADMMEMFTVLISNTKLKSFYKIVNLFIETYFLKYKIMNDRKYKQVKYAEWWKPNYYNNEA